MQPPPPILSHQEQNLDFLTEIPAFPLRRNENPPLFSASAYPKLLDVTNENQFSSTNLFRPTHRIKFKLWTDENNDRLIADPQQTRRPIDMLWQKICGDHKNYYSCGTFYRLGLATGFHAVLSNTSFDRNCRHWYQNHVRSSSTDSLSKGFKVFGEGSLWIPVFGMTTGVYCLTQKYGPDYFSENFIGELSAQTIRSYLVGTPTLLLGQFMPGCSRPDDFRFYHSAWRPFQDNNSLSGHAFIGAVPFWVAAQMTNRFWLKSAFYLCSTFAGISRINDDSHYLSQVLLGWYVASLSVSAVCKTENMFSRRGLDVFPIVNSKNIGIWNTFFKIIGDQNKRS
jgi:hypothetical protein